MHTFVCSQHSNVGYEHFYKIFSFTIVQVVFYAPTFSFEVRPTLMDYFNNKQKWGKSTSSQLTTFCQDNTLKASFWGLLGLVLIT